MDRLLRPREAVNLVGLSPRELNNYRNRDRDSLSQGKAVAGPPLREHVNPGGNVSVRYAERDVVASANTRDNRSHRA